MRRLVAILLTMSALAAGACATKNGSISTVAAISEPTSTGGDASLAGKAVTEFGYALLAPLRADGRNVVISPASVAIALAMTEPGATGDARAQIGAALRITDRDAFHAGMTALRASLESAKAPEKTDSKDSGKLEISIANAIYMQDGYPIEQSYIDALSKYYGPLLNVVDFATNAADATDGINEFVKDETRERIPEILKTPLPADTVLALVNALYLKASWDSKFHETKDEEFTRLDGSKLTTPLMHGSSSKSTKGDGFVAARKHYSARLAMDFVLPDEARFDDVASRLGTAFGALDDDPADGTTLVAPKLKTTYDVELPPALQALGITAPFATGNLLGIANDPELYLDTAVHATFLAVDEEGTEAAAATVFGFRAVGAEIGSDKEPVPVILDRPFFFRIVDRETGATLFLGQILSPVME